MKKQYKFLSAIVIIIACVFILLPGLAGRYLKSHLKTDHKKFNKKEGGAGATLVLKRYQKGWFHSTAWTRHLMWNHLV
ncbi:MAG: hypothetical protein COB66_00325 [Coxiella sp. (in: Bacteria)]|nr:MAG: hypothetical protein COB66_00325 [Coxiella sp. (in: g-proteobacteria)]